MSMSDAQNQINQYNASVNATNQDNANRLNKFRSQPPSWGQTLGNMFVQGGSAVLGGWASGGFSGGGGGFGGGGASGGW